MTDLELQTVIDGMKISAREGEPLDPTVVAGGTIFQMPQLNKRVVVVDGIQCMMQFTVTHLPTDRLLELFSVGPCGDTTALPDSLVLKLARMVFPEPITFSEILPAMRQAIGQKCGLVPPKGFELNRQFFRIFP